MKWSWMWLLCDSFIVQAEVIGCVTRQLGCHDAAHISEGRSKQTSQHLFVPHLS